MNVSTHGARSRAWLPLALFTGFLGLLVNSFAAIPSPEKLLPDDTLLMLTIPDYTAMREIYKTSPQSQFWNDPAMKPLKENFICKRKEEVVKPLERELDMRMDDYTGLLQGQLTFAMTQNGWQGKDEQQLGLVVLLDAKDKSGQLKTNLANIRKKWLDADKTIQT